MGWLVIIAIKPIYETLPAGGLWLLVAGGLAYTFGVIFFVWEKLTFNHAIWHLFVLARCHSLYSKISLLSIISLKRLKITYDIEYT